MAQLGSAFVEYQVDDTRFIFSGDLGASNSPLLPPPGALEQQRALAERLRQAAARFLPYLKSDLVIRES